MPARTPADGGYSTAPGGKNRCRCPDVRYPQRTIHRLHGHLSCLRGNQRRLMLKAVIQDTRGIAHQKSARWGRCRNQQTGERNRGIGTSAVSAMVSAKIGAGQGQGLFDTGAAQPTFRSIFQELTEDIIDSSGDAPVDVVFVVDASNSMQR